MSDAGNLVREARDEIENLMQRAIEVRRLMEKAQIRADKLQAERDDLASRLDRLNGWEEEGTKALRAKIEEQAKEIERLQRIADLEKLCRQWRLGVALEDIRAGDMVDVEVDAAGCRLKVRPARWGV